MGHALLSASEPACGVHWISYIIKNHSMSSFWSKLKKPIFAMAPLANVTDVVFREIIARHGKPDVFYTEFVSADGLTSKGREILLRDLKYTENQRPIVAQFFTSRPENMFKAASLARELGFDGVDINMGCPDKSVVKQGAGAALIKNPVLAKEIIAAAKEGTRSTSRGKADLPVSVKPRLGYNKIEIDTWIHTLLETNIAALAIHLRTVKEMSKTPAHWEMLAEIVKMRNATRFAGVSARRASKKSKTLIIGNGDVMTLEEGRRKAKETGADGIMFGRAMFGNPFLFRTRPRNKNAPTEASERPITTQEKLKLLLEHVELFEEIWGDAKDFNIMKKHFKAYVSGFDGASGLRAKLMEAKNAEGVKKILATAL